MIASTTASNIVRRLPSPLLRAVRRLRGRRARRELETWLAGVAPLFGGFENKRVLDVGSDVAGTTVDVIGTRFSPREVIGLNLGVSDCRIASHARLENGDIRGTRYPDHDFDLIVSSSAFEHISGFAGAVAEMHRILAPRITSEFSRRVTSMCWSSRATTIRSSPRYTTRP
jgi:SAM-dependent methyltransferase